VRRRGVEVVNAHTGSGHAWAWWGTAGRRAALVRTRGDARAVSRNPGHAWLFRRTDAVVGASGCIAAQYQAAFPEAADRVWTVYPGSDVPEPAPEPAGPVRIALLGRLDPVKGQSYFLEAVEQLRPVLKDEEFIVAGEQKNTPLEELKRAADKLHVSRWVRFVGRQESAASFMASCHAGVVASVGSEALSRACLEWMAAGRPVVATAVGCLPELVQSGENGFLVPPRSPGALASCFRGLLEQPELRREMGRKARERARKDFSLERMAQETEKVYESALRRRWGKGGRSSG
jgi:glycosyltransferase involved in cell wall biosynthesis